ncbi:hypothetical protein KGQ72_03220 [Patescibacteria group bacterium]|nr:hypothetical protein [Patescibacteria group bacterium]
MAPFETQIKLLAIQPETKCTAVEIAVTHLVILGGGYVDYVKVVHDPNDEEFASFRSAYDRIIREFLRRLERA